MKTGLLLTGLILLTLSAASAGTSSYRIDDSKVEAAFAQSMPYAVDHADSGLALLSFHLAEDRIEDPDPVTAILLSLFLGSTGLHRIYLGSEIKMVYFYVLSCFGVFGIIPLIDTFVLIGANASNDLSPYIGNDRFIMWGF